MVSKEVDFTLKVMRLMADEDIHEDIYWVVGDEKDNFRFSVTCNDIFFWGSADGEDLTPENFGDLLQAIEDEKKIRASVYTVWGPMLFCARMRKQRPQGAVYESIDEAVWPLFDACGEEREVGFGNPHAHPVATKTPIMPV
jgi:hypothetical protein